MEIKPPPAKEQKTEALRIRYTDQRVHKMRHKAYTPDTGFSI